MLVQRFMSNDTHVHVVFSISINSMMLSRPTFLLAGDLNSPSYMPQSGYSVIASGRWRDLWREAEAPCCCQATFPSYGCGGLFGMRT